MVQSSRVEILQTSSHLAHLLSVVKPAEQTNKHWESEHMKYVEFSSWKHLLEIKSRNLEGKVRHSGVVFFTFFFFFFPCLPAWRFWWLIRLKFDISSLFLLGAAFQHMLCNCSSIYPALFSRKGSSTDCSPERQKWTLLVNADTVFFVHAKLTVHGNT